MKKPNEYPECVRFEPTSNSLVFAVTDGQNEVVAVHQVFLTQSAKEIGRKTTGLADEGYVRFFGDGPPIIFEGEPEDGMKLWSETGSEVWVDISGLKDTPSISN